MWNWLTGYDEENAQRAAAADAEIKRINAAKVASGYYNQAQAEAIARNAETDAYLDSIAAQTAIEESFDEGWQEGRENVSNAISGTLNRILADPLRAIIGGLPWWLWLAAGLAAFAYFGGFRWIKKALAR